MSQVSRMVLVDLMAPFLPVPLESMTGLAGDDGWLAEVQPAGHSHTLLLLSLLSSVTRVVVTF